MFFQRLLIYTELPSTMEMMGLIIQIMVEILSILGIATRKMKQGRMSKHLFYKYEDVDGKMFRNFYEEVNRNR